MDELSLLLSLSRNSDNPKQYRVRYYDQNGDLSYIHEQNFDYTFVDTTDYGLYALDYENGLYHFLGVDSIGQDIYLRANPDFSVNSIFNPENSNINTSVVGIAVYGDEIFFGLKDRTIVPFTQ